MRSTGGLSGPLASFETGQTKIEWYLNYFPISISIGYSFDYWSSYLSYYLVKQFIKPKVIFDNFKNFGRANVPAVIVTDNALSGSIPFI